MAGGLVQVILTVFLALLLPGPARPAPLALRVEVPLDRWRPVIVQPRATLPTKPRGEIDDGRINLSVPKPEVDGDGEAGDDDETTWRLKFRGMDLPRKFGAYDLDQSHGVSLVELAAVTDTEMRDARKPFNAADVDGNEILSQEEFTQAPWIFDAGGITLIDSAADPGVEAVEGGVGVAESQP